MLDLATALRTSRKAPTAEPVPVTRKSPFFHFAVPIETVSVTAVGVSGPWSVDSGP